MGFLAEIDNIRNFHLLSNVKIIDTIKAHLKDILKILKFLVNFRIAIISRLLKRKGKHKKTKC
jgi:hypothetical protein